MEKAKEKIVWIDWLRVISTLAVIIIHSAANLNRQFGQVLPQEWWAAKVWQGISRFCVPVFFMISGVTVLGRDLPIKDHFRKPFIRTEWVKKIKEQFGDVLIPLYRKNHRAIKFFLKNGYIVGETIENAVILWQ